MFDQINIGGNTGQDTTDAVATASSGEVSVSVSDEHHYGSGNSVMCL